MLLNQVNWEAGGQYDWWITWVAMVCMQGIIKGYM